MTELGTAALEGVLDAEDLAALRDSVRDVLSAESDSLSVHAFIDRKSDLDARLMRQAEELGWLSLPLPEAAGGLGLGSLGLRLLCEEAGRVAAPGPLIAELVAGQTLAAISEARESQSVAIAALWNQPSSGKVMILGAVAPQIALVPVAGDCVAVVDLGNTECRPLDVWDRTRSLFEVELPAEPLRVLPAPSAKNVQRHFAICLAADSCGLSRGILARTIDYTVGRVQFDRPVASFQAVKHRVVDLLARTVLAEQSLAQAVEADLAGDPAADMWAMLAKASASDAAVAVAGGCIQLHGGVGFTWEYDPHIYAKRARANQTLLGDNHRLRDFAADELSRLTADGRTVLELRAA